MKTFKHHDKYQKIQAGVSEDSQGWRTQLETPELVAYGRNERGAAATI